MDLEGQYTLEADICGLPEDLDLGHGLCWGRSSQLQERLSPLPEDPCLVGTWVTCWEARGSPITLTSLALDSTLRQRWRRFRVTLNLSFNTEAASGVAFQIECLKRLITLIKS